jgi:hypothetical protein
VAETAEVIVAAHLRKPLPAVAAAAAQTKILMKKAETAVAVLSLSNIKELRLL